MTEAHLTTLQRSNLLARFGRLVAENIQTVIYGLLLILVVDILFICLYFFCSVDVKAKPTSQPEENKERPKPASTQSAHKCKDPNFQHAKYAEDMRVDEDENLVFDEQADVVFMQPGFHIKDSVVQSNQPRA
jgi:hypothetical protein